MRYKVVQTKPAMHTWVYYVEADSVEEAIDRVEAGEIEHDTFWTDDEFQGEYEYEAVEQDTPLVEFLKRKGVYEQALTNVKNPLCNGCEILKGHLNHAFIWEHTPEGHSFWSELHKEYLDES